MHSKPTIFLAIHTKQEVVVFKPLDSSAEAVQSIPVNPNTAIKNGICRFLTLLNNILEKE